MLQTLQIDHFTLINKQTIDFHPGFSVITGETGAGKSLIFDALYVLMGKKVSSSAIAPGQDSCHISAQFDISQHEAAQAWLRAHDLDDSSCIIRRILYTHKSSRCHINDQLVTVKQLKSFTQLLLHVHSQHASYRLCDSDTQRQLLDNFANNQDTRHALQQHYQQLQTLTTKIAHLKDTVAEQAERLAIIDYHLEELQALDCHNTPYEALKQRVDQLKESTQFQAHLQHSIQRLEAGSQAILPTLHKIIVEAEKPTLTFPEYGATCELLQASMTQLEEATREMRHQQQTVTDQRHDYAELTTQLDAFHQLARKHRVTPDALPQTIDALETKRLELLAAEQSLEALEHEAEATRHAYVDIAQTLHTQRSNAASAIGKQVQKLLPKLGMPEGILTIEVGFDAHKLALHGSDHIAFRFSANPGHEPTLLKQSASGGELSRISLILELLAIEHSALSTILFDEVDTGVSGKVARDMGLLLKTLGKSTQVMSITHLPQIASLADYHYKVEKITGKQHTESTITQLDHTGTITEIARLLDGSAISDTAIRQAEALLTTDS